MGTMQLPPLLLNTSSGVRLKKFSQRDQSWEARARFVVRANASERERECVLQVSECACVWVCLRV